MKVTAEHVAAFGYWRTPASLRARAPNLQPPNIHRLINQHAGIKPHGVGVNALSLLRLKLSNRKRESAYRRPDLDAVLEPSHWDAHNNPQRFFAFRRWQANYRRARKEIEKAV